MSTAKESDTAAQAAVEGRTPDQSGAVKRPAAEKTPAGPHADPSLLNPDATPGTGALPPADSEAQGNMDSTSS